MALVICFANNKNWFIDTNFKKETKKINQSIFILKCLVKNLSEKHPITKGFYNQSILTNLLKNSIGGLAKTYVIIW